MNSSDELDDELDSLCDRLSLLDDIESAQLVKRAMARIRSLESRVRVLEYEYDILRTKHRRRNGRVH